MKGRSREKIGEVKFKIKTEGVVKIKRKDRRGKIKRNDIGRG